MADCCNRFAGLIEGLHQLQDLLVQAQVFRGTATGHQQRVVIRRIDLGEVKVQRKQMPRLFAVGLIAFEIVDCRTYGLPGGFIRTHRMHGVADHQQRLKRHHHFVVFDVVADQHQNFFSGHGNDSSRRNTWATRVFKVVLNPLSR